jgi:hypothetical protein
MFGSGFDDIRISHSVIGCTTKTPRHKEKAEIKNHREKTYPLQVSAFCLRFLLGLFGPW